MKGASSLQHSCSKQEYRFSKRFKEDKGKLIFILNFKSSYYSTLRLLQQLQLLFVFRLTLPSLSLFQFSSSPTSSSFFFSQLFPPSSLSLSISSKFKEALKLASNILSSCLRKPCANPKTFPISNGDERAWKHAVPAVISWRQ